MVDGQVIGAIGRGLLVLVGIESKDGDADVQWLSRKIPNLRIFPDDHGRMHHSVRDLDAELLVVSQFTLFASTKKGMRPAFLGAADPEQAIPLYEQFIQRLQDEIGKEVATGSFGADMQVALVNDGPVTIQMDTKRRE